MIPAEITIFDEIGARLAGLTAKNGYTIDLATTPKREMPIAEDGKELPELHYYPISHATDQNSYGGDEHTIRLIVKVRARTYSQKFPDVAATIIAEVMTVINRDPAAPSAEGDISNDLGGTVSDLSMFRTGYQIGEGSKPWVGALVEIIVTYQSDHGDMFNFNP